MLNNNVKKHVLRALSERKEGQTDETTIYSGNTFIQKELAIAHMTATTLKTRAEGRLTSVKLSSSSEKDAHDI